MSMLDKLLADKLLDPVPPHEEDFEIPRLSRRYGEPFLLHLKPISMGELEITFNYYKNDQGGFDVRELCSELIKKCCTDPDWNDKRLVQKLGCKKFLWATEDTVRRVLTLNEMGQLLDKICAICGLWVDPKDDDEEARQKLKDILGSLLGTQ